MTELDLDGGLLCTQYSLQEALILMPRVLYTFPVPVVLLDAHRYSKQYVILMQSSGLLLILSKYE